MVKVIPVGHHDQYLMRIDKSETGEVSEHKELGVRYVPLVKE